MKFSIYQETKNKLIILSTDDSFWLHTLGSDFLNVSHDINNTEIHVHFYQHHRNISYTVCAVTTTM